MRYALVRIWAVLTIGLLAGALGDVGTEFSATFGWLGGTTRDVDQQGVLPVFAITVMLALGLAAYVVGSRVAPGDPLVRRLDDVRARAVDAIAAFAGSCATVVAIEGYETHFGGLAPFDAHSVVVAHAPILVLSFVIDRRRRTDDARRGDPLCRAQWRLGCSIPYTFLRISRSLPATPKHATRPDPEASCSHVAPEIVKSHGLRAPPRMLPAQPSLPQQAAAREPSRAAWERVPCARSVAFSPFFLQSALSFQRAEAAELVTGAILGTVSTTAHAPIANARISAIAPSGRYTGTTDASGRFTILGVAPDTYAVSVEAQRLRIGQCDARRLARRARAARGRHARQTQRNRAGRSQGSGVRASAARATSSRCRANTPEPVRRKPPRRVSPTIRATPSRARSRTSPASSKTHSPT